MKKCMSTKTAAIVISTVTMFQVAGMSTSLIDMRAFAAETLNEQSSAPEIGTSENNLADPTIEVTTPNAVEIKLEKDPEDNAFILQTYLKVDDKYISKEPEDIKYLWYCEGELLYGGTSLRYLGKDLNTINGKKYKVEVWGGEDKNILLADKEYIVDSKAAEENPQLPRDSDLLVSESNGELIIEWNKATDSNTSQSNLKYYLYKTENKEYYNIKEWEVNGNLVFSGTFPDSQENGQCTVDGIKDNATYYFKLIVEDQDGNKTAYNTEKRSSFIRNVEILRDRDTLKAIVIDRYKQVIYPEAQYEWSVNGNVIGNEKTLKVDSSYNFKTIKLKVTVAGYNEPFTADYEANVGYTRVFRQNNVLVCVLFDENGNLITTDFDVNYTWKIDGIVIGNEQGYTLKAEDYGKEIEVEAKINHTDETFLNSGMFKDTKGAAVRLEGSTRVNNTLTAFVVDSNNNDMSKELTPIYDWYRLDENNEDALAVAIKEGKAVYLGTGNKYALTNEDNGKYIRVVAKYKDSDGSTRELLPAFTTSIITKKSSSGGSSSGSGSSDSSSNSSNNNSGTNNQNASANNGSGATNGVETKIFQNNENGTMKIVNAEGQALVGWNQVNGKWYLTNLEGVVQTGWQKAGDGKWYYLNYDGSMQTGWQKVNGTWYYLNDTGAMETGWKSSGGKWYLLNSDGSMATGWQQVNGKWYFLYSDGSMASNTTIGGYRVNDNGEWY